MVEDEENEEEILCSYRMIVINLTFRNEASCNTGQPDLGVITSSPYTAKLKVR